MATIRLHNVTKQFAGQVVLEGVTLDLHAGETTGLVGANGVGKTTLFRLIHRQLEPDLGTVTLAKGTEIGYLEQEPRVSEERTLHDEAVSAFEDLFALERKMHALSEMMAAKAESPELPKLLEEYDRVNARFVAAGGYAFEQRVNEILGGLGFSPSEYGKPVKVLSGGQKCRLALAKLLLQERQFLLLDEPTNHLDIDAVRWLERFLAGHHGGAVIISHDRYLLDRLADRIIEIENREVCSYPGNYTNYVRAKEVRRLEQQRNYEKDRAFIEKERAFIEKHIGKQRTKEAEGRRKRLERRMKEGEFATEAPREQRNLKLKFGEARRHGHDVLAIEDLSKGFDGHALFADLNLSLRVGDHVGITGPNGTGKTTLLRIVLGDVAAETGTVHLDSKVRVGYFAQDAGRLNPDHTIVQELQDAAQMTEGEARSYAARFQFRGEDPFKLIGQLSGGEQSRVRLMKLILEDPNLLILDEPTNHLDIPSREALEEALDAFPGTILTVSHDRYFLDRMVDRLLILRPDHHKVYNGNYSYYIDQVEQERAREQAAAEAAALAAKKARRSGAQREKKKPVSQQQKRLAKMPLEELEALIAQHEARIGELNERFGVAEVYKDAEAVAKLRDEFDTLKAELAEAEEAWLERAE